MTTGHPTPRATAPAPATSTRPATPRRRGRPTSSVADLRARRLDRGGDPRRWSSALPPPAPSAEGAWRCAGRRPPRSAGSRFELHRSPRRQEVGPLVSMTAALVADPARLPGQRLPCRGPRGCRPGNGADLRRRRGRRLGRAAHLREPFQVDPRGGRLPSSPTVDLDAVEAPARSAGPGKRRVVRPRGARSRNRPAVARPHEARGAAERRKKAHLLLPHRREKSRKRTRPPRPRRRLRPRPARQGGFAPASRGGRGQAGPGLPAEKGRGGAAASTAREPTVPTAREAVYPSCGAGAGARMPKRARQPTPRPWQPLRLFVDTAVAEQDRLPALVLATDPESDYWFWQKGRLMTPPIRRPRAAASRSAPRAPSRPLPPPCGWPALRRLGRSCPGITTAPASV